MNPLTIAKIQVLQARAGVATPRPRRDSERLSIAQRLRICLIEAQKKEAKK